MSHLIDRLPADDKTNGWSAILPQRQPRAALQGDVDVEWLVIGAGYAGISAARELARLQPTTSIAVVEAGIVGENASGRNSGFAIDLPYSPSYSPELAEVGKRAIRVNRFAIHMLDELVETHAIDCNWAHSGRYHVAVTDQVATHQLKAYTRYLEIWKEEFEWCDRSALDQRLGTDYYSGGFFTPGTRLMNPAALVRGLADSLPEQVQLFENSPVIEAELNGKSPWARTSEGRINAKHVILAVNAYSQSFGVYQKYQIPILLFASLTRPLTEGEVAQLGTDETWGVTPAHGVAGSTLRLTADKRLMIRQGFEYSPNLNTTGARRATAKAMNLRLLRRRFPKLRDLSLEHFWMGWLAVSQNHAPAFGQIGDNAYAISCCNGSGIVRHTAGGTLIANFAMNIKNPLIDDFLVQGRGSYIPPRPFRDVGVGVKLAWDMWRGKAEQ